MHNVDCLAERVVWPLWGYLTMHGSPREYWQQPSTAVSQHPPRGRVMDTLVELYQMETLMCVLTRSKGGGRAACDFLSLYMYC